MVHDPARQPHDDGSAYGAKRPAVSIHPSPASRGRLELAFADLCDRLQPSMSETEIEALVQRLAAEYHATPRPGLGAGGELPQRFREAVAQEGLGRHVRQRLVASIREGNRA